MAKSKPVRIFAAHGVEAAIFENERDGQRQRVIRVTRRYSDAQGYHLTDRYFERDLANLELVVREARRYLTLRTITPRDVNQQGQNEDAATVDHTR